MTRPDSAEASANLNGVTGALATRARPAAAERLANPEAVLSRSDLRELGHERRAIDAVFRACPIIALRGYARPLIRVADYLEFIERHTYRGDRVRHS